MIKSSLKDNYTKSTLSTNKQNLEKLIKFQISKPLEQELKISVINPIMPNLSNQTPIKSNLKTKNLNAVVKEKTRRKPSDKLKLSVSDPFNTEKKNKTNFGYVYSAGGIPCRILHGSNKLKLKWDIEPESNCLNY